MLSCKDASIMVSQSLDRKLTLRERLNVKIHLMMCTACQRMARQMQLLRAASQRYRITGEDESHPEQHCLSKEASARIMRQLEQAAHKNTDQE